MTEMTKVPVRDNVGAALRFVRANWRLIAFVAGIGAAVTAVIGALALAAPPLGLLTGVATGLTQAVVYAVLTGAVLFGAAEARSRAASDGGRVWAAMVIVGFLMVIVMFVVTIPVSMALAVGPLAPYVQDLTNAGQDRAAVSAIMMRFAEANPGALLAVLLFYAAVWLVLTSRLYLAAPATVDQRRILTFETWAWTKGNTLRIIAARLMLLLPANIFIGAIGFLIGQSVGLNVLDMGSTAAAAAANPAGFLIYLTASTFLTFALFSSLEAALSAYLYRSLRPAAA